MNRFALVLFLFLFGRVGAKAQDYYIEQPRPFTGGIVVGTNISKVDDIDDFSQFHKVGWNVGGIVHIKFTQQFNVAMEMLFSQKGDHEVNESNSVAIGSYFAEYYLRLNYVEVPVTLHYKKAKWDYELGLSYARLISSFESISIDQPVFLDPNLYYFNKDDYEMIFGASYKFYKHYQINMRYQFSLVPIRPLDRFPYSYYAYDGQQNSVVNIRLIYLFD